MAIRTQSVIIFGNHGSSTDSLEMLESVIAKASLSYLDCSEHLLLKVQYGPKGSTALEIMATAPTQ
ncbi:hypothetical protein J6590_090690 [Homalodisca vitripennis]|nr:hypothetical protein J6590_090690 [Homalodisca vitripennis]